MFHGTLFGAVFLQSLGELAVSVFFFLSGYGLMYSYKKKNVDYQRTFLRRRVFPFYAIILFLTIVYAFFHIVMKHKVSIMMFLKALTFGGEIISNGWYLQVQLLLYIMFFGVCKIFKSTYAQIVGIFVCEIGYCLIVASCGFSAYWFQSVLTFTLGLTWAAYKEKIDKLLLDNNYIKLLFVSALMLFGSTFFVKYFIDDFTIKTLIRMISNILFVIFFVICICFIRIDFILMKWMGKFSLEVYVVQGIFLALYHSQFIDLKNAYIYILAVISSTVIAAYFLYPINRYIYRIFLAEKERKKNESTMVL